LEGGALIAGVALSTLPSRHEIGARLAPLRDFFIVAFFILLGTRMVVSDFDAILIPAIILSIFVLIGNPLLQLIVMGVMGYRKKTSFQTGMMAAQISEFSLILVALGVSLNQVAPTVLSIVTLVGIITIFISSYLILYSDTFYRYVAKYLTIFERRHARDESVQTVETSAILIGGSRIGFDFIKLFTDEHRSFLVVDHDPDVIEKLQAAGVATEYGDAGDPDLLDDIKIGSAELVVSTVPDLETNLIALSCAKREGKSPTTVPVVIVVAHQISAALELYDAGADYVILPHFLGGSYAATLVQQFAKEALNLQDIRSEHIKHLQSRVSHGHEHPQIEHHR
jgi:Trk K+ transport system NAD-binding subunit